MDFDILNDKNAFISTDFQSLMVKLDDRELRFKTKIQGHGCMTILCDENSLDRKQIWAKIKSNIDSKRFIQEYGKKISV